MRDVGVGWRDEVSRPPRRWNELTAAGPYSANPAPLPATRGEPCGETWSRGHAGAIAMRSRPSRPTRSGGCSISLSSCSRDRDLADDAVQETLVLAWRDLKGLRDPDGFDAWLHRVLVRCVYREAEPRAAPSCPNGPGPGHPGPFRSGPRSRGPRRARSRLSPASSRASSRARPPPLPRLLRRRSCRCAGRPGRDDQVEAQPRDVRAASRARGRRAARRPPGRGVRPMTADRDFDRQLGSWFERRATPGVARGTPGAKPRPSRGHPPAPRLVGRGPLASAPRRRGAP